MNEPCVIGAEGDLRVYLEGLSEAEDVQRFVEQHPFGQKPITESSESWSFYLRVISETELYSFSNHDVNSSSSLHENMIFH